MNQPLFSIVIANYNYGRFLDDAIQSVIAQNMGEQVELIICDAASTDNSVKVIKKYANGLPPNIRYEQWVGKIESQPTQLITWWCSEKDGGQSAAFNKGFSHAKGRFLTWLNADDVLMPGALSAMCNLIKNNAGHEWFSGSSLYVDSSLRLVKWFRCHNFSPMRARYGFLMCGGPSSFFTKRILDAVGGVDESLHYLMDIDLWYKFVRKLNIRYIRTAAAIFAYRIHGESKMSGADVVQTDQNSGNRAKARQEFDLLSERYNLPSPWIRKLATILSFSVIDKIISVTITILRKGKDVRYA